MSERTAKTRRQIRLSERRRFNIENGLCPRCSKRPMLEGQKQCEDCQTYMAQWNRKQKLAILDHYGSECACCGEKEVEFLSIDHIDGGGTAHRREIGRGNLYKWLKSNGFPDGFRTLCMNCNTAMGLYGLCPHQMNGTSRI